MSQHGCPERLSNRSKGFQDEGPSQSTMEVLVETLTGTAFEMTVSPSDTIFAIKSKIFRVEGIPVAQQHLLYNLKELDDASSLHEHAISDGARLRLVLGMRGGPISTRRLPPPPNTEPWRDIERLLDSNREDGDWGSGGSGGSGCKVTVLVFRDGERVNMLRVRENHDGTYSPIDHNKYSSSLTHLVEHEQEIETDDGLSGSLHENAVTMGKMMELRRRMEHLNVSRGHHNRNDKVEMQKTRSEETLSVNSLLEDGAHLKRTLAFAHDDDTFAPLCDGSYTRYDYDCSFADRYTLLPPIGTRTDSDQSVQEAVAESERLKLSDALSGSILVKGGRREAREEEAAILEECLDADDCHLRQDSPQLTANNLAPIAAAEYVGPVVGGEVEGWRAVGFGVGPHSHSASSLHAVRPTPAPRHHPPLSDALFSSSTSDLEKLKRNSRILPALSRHRNREHLHLSDEGLDLSHHGIPHPLEVGNERRHTTSKNLEVGGERQNRTSYPLEVGGERQNKTSYSLEVGGERQNRTTYPLEVGGERRNRISYPLEIGGERQNRTLYSQELNKEKCQNLSFQVGGERQNRTSYSLDIDAHRNQNKIPQPLEIGIEKQNLTAYHLEVESERRQNRTSHSLEDEERQYRTSYPLVVDGERHPSLEVGGERKCRAQNRTTRSLEIASEKSVSRTPNSLLGERCQDLSSPTKGRLFRVEDDSSLKEVEVKKQEVKEKERKIRIRCGFCRKRLSIATVHRCRCGATFCAPHRYAEVHGCLYDYKAQAHAYLAQANPLVSAPKLPKI